MKNHPRPNNKLGRNACRFLMYCDAIYECLGWEDREKQKKNLKRVGVTNEMCNTQLTKAVLVDGCNRECAGSPMPHIASRNWTPHPLYKAQQPGSLVRRDRAELYICTLHAEVRKSRPAAQLYMLARLPGHDSSHVTQRDYSEGVMQRPSPGNSPTDQLEGESSHIGTFLFSTSKGEVASKLLMARRMERVPTRDKHFLILPPFPAR